MKNLITAVITITLISIASFGQNDDRPLTNALREFGGTAETGTFDLATCISDIEDMRQATFAGVDEEGNGWTLPLGAALGAMAGGALSTQNFKAFLTASEKSAEEFKKSADLKASYEKKLIQYETINRAFRGQLARAYAMEQWVILHDKLSKNVALTAREISDKVFLESIYPKWKDENVWKQQLRDSLRSSDGKSPVIRDWVAAAKTNKENVNRILTNNIRNYPGLKLNARIGERAGARGAAQLKAAKRFAAIGLSKVLAGGILGYLIAEAAMSAPAADRPGNFLETDIIKDKNPRVLCNRAVNGDAPEVKNLVYAWRQAKSKIWLIEKGAGTAQADAFLPVETTK